MTTMYQSHFGLAAAPFSIAPDPRYLYMSQRHQEALAHLHLRHLRTKSRKGLGQLTTNRPAAQHHQAPGDCIELGECVPQGVAGDITHLVQPGQRRHKGLRACGDDDAAGRQAHRLRRVVWCIVKRNLHRPRVDQGGVAL